jgi:hypothetical protein
MLKGRCSYVSARRRRRTQGRLARLRLGNWTEVGDDLVTVRCPRHRRWKRDCPLVRETATGIRKRHPLAQVGMPVLRVVLRREIRLAPVKSNGIISPFLVLNICRQNYFFFSKIILEK